MADQIYGLLAEFESPDALLAAADRARKEGYTRMDAYSPYPVEGLAEALGRQRTGIAPAVLAGGILGGAGAYFMEYFAMAVDYPINVGGRPLHSWPAFIPITFELTILSASLVGFVALLVLNGLPRLHHPVFNIDRFERASVDGFFLCIETRDPKFGTGTKSFLEEAEAKQIWEVGP